MKPVYLTPELNSSVRQGQLLCPIHLQELELFCHDLPDPLASCPSCSSSLYAFSKVLLVPTGDIRPVEGSKQ